MQSNKAMKIQIHYIFTLLVFKCILEQSQVDTNRIDEDGLRQGPWTEYINERGLTKLVGGYKDDKKDGWFYAHYSNDSVAVIANYKDGLLEGELRNFHSNGSLKFIGVYKAGMKNGKFTDFWENGNVKTINHYCNDTICGDYFEYFKSGIIQISAIKSKSNDKIDNWVLYYENRAIRLTGRKLGDENIGDWVEYSEDGQILKVINH